MRRIVRLVFAGAAALIGDKLAPIAAAQCAMCRTGLMNSPEGQHWVTGFNNGILFLLAVPVIIFSSVAFLLWRAGRKRAQAAGQLPQAPWQKESALAAAAGSENPISASGEIGEPA